MGVHAKKTGDATKKSPAIEMLVVCRPKLLWHMFCQLSYHKKTSVAIFQRLCPSCSRSHLGGHRETTTRTNTLHSTQSKRAKLGVWTKLKLPKNDESAASLAPLIEGFEGFNLLCLPHFGHAISWVRETDGRACWWNDLKSLPGSEIKGSRLYLYQWSPDPKNLLRG